jgi:2-oxoglutarate ferredoxin oxidoreductase subunit gamma
MMTQYEVLWAGFGGQGIMVAGMLLSYTGIKEGKQVCWIPSYGPEMRGGTAYCTVVVSDHRIGSPIIRNPQAAVVFNRPSFDKFTPTIKPGGLLVVNSSLIDVVTDRTDVTQVLVPANEIALAAGSAKTTNIVMLGAFVGCTGLVKYENLEKVLEEKLGGKKDLLAINLRVLQEGYNLGMASRKQKKGAGV